MFRSVQLALFKSSNKTEKVIIYTVLLWLCICCTIQGLAQRKNNVTLSDSPPPRSCADTTPLQLKFNKDRLLNTLRSHEDCSIVNNCNNKTLSKFATVILLFILKFLEISRGFSLFLSLTKSFGGQQSISQLCAWLSSL